MKFDVLTLFPEMFDGFINTSIIKRAIEKGLLEVNLINFRDYSPLNNKQVDDTPYGGGAGMVLKCDIMDRCLEANKALNSHICLMTPQGHQYKQEDARRLSMLDDIILVCGHYEGFDERIRDYVDEEISIGDFVLTGGELPSMIISDSITRLLDGAILKDSYEGDSYSNGLLEYPQYTRPQSYKGISVPFVLQNGNHKEINRWRQKESLRRTYLRRPDLLEKYQMTKDDYKLLDEIKSEEEK